MGPYVSSKVLMCPYGSIWIYIDPYKSLCDLKYFNESLWVLILPYSSLLFLINFYRS